MNDLSQNILVFTPLNDLSQLSLVFMACLPFARFPSNLPDAILGTKITGQTCE